MKAAPTSGEQVQGTRGILALGLSSCRAAVLTIAISSGILSVLYLTGTFLCWRSMTVSFQAAAFRPL